ncbi:MAG: Gfo/Idh/MocA family oxidoreductase [Fuerstiella sp.]|nr:Gfo/Idh/MocA family oxidoreductase [Fuerstiella sp.]
MKKELRIGILGCGPVAQIAHFDACRKSRNIQLYAISDLADDLRTRMATMWEPQVAYRTYDEMLADDQVEAIIVAVADEFHVPLATQAIESGKHVFVEKPMGVGVEECEALKRTVDTSGLILQVGNNRRFDPGITFAKQFLNEEMGGRIDFKAWYYDSADRYTMTDNLQPIVHQSDRAIRPDGNPKSDRRRYYVLGHASHLVDTARLLGGEIVSVRARLLERYGTWCWYVDVDFSDGSLGHLDLIIAVQGDFEEGFMIHGEHGSVKGRVFLPWYHKSSVVECFSSKDRVFRRPLGADSYTYKTQLEGFADTILYGKPQHGANVDDGVAAMRTMVAIARSAETGETVRLSDVTGVV